MRETCLAVIARTSSKCSQTPTLKVGSGVDAHREIKGRMNWKFRNKEEEEIDTIDGFD